MQCHHICYCEFSGFEAAQLGIWTRGIINIPAKSFCVLFINQTVPSVRTVLLGSFAPSVGVRCSTFLLHVVASSSRVTGHWTKVCLWYLCISNLMFLGALIITFTLKAKYRFHAVAMLFQLCTLLWWLLLLLLLLLLLNCFVAVTVLLLTLY